MCGGDSAIKNQKTKIKNQSSVSAFTLTEILIAIFVLSIGLMGVISVFPVGVDATTKTLERSASAMAVGTAISELQHSREAAKRAATITASPASTVTCYPSSTATDARDLGVKEYAWNAVLSPPSIIGVSDKNMAFVQIAFYTQSPIANTASGVFFAWSTGRIAVYPPNHFRFSR